MSLVAARSCRTRHGEKKFEGLGDMSGPFEPQGIVPPSVAASNVNAPATALLVIAILNVIGALYGMVTNLMTVGAPPVPVDAPQGVDPQMFMRMMQGAGAMGVVFNVIAIGVAVVILLGALKMKKLESFGLAMTAAILAMIPCLSPCCILGLPFGIWALVVLNKPEVKSAFH
jgi:hypothetical protein